jgi:mitogen-activated protein kinase kinase kinase
MRRHIPTLFPHPEQDIQSEDHPDDPDETRWGIRRPTSYNTPSASSPHSPHRGRIRLRKQNLSFNPNNGTTTSSDSPRQVSKYSDIYSQFVRRYRSEPGVEDDPRNDPDNHYFQRGLGQLLDAGDSDDEDLSNIDASRRGSIDRMTLESESTQSATSEERQRLGWETMLASVLDGDVLKSEKTRISVALESSAEEQNRTHLNIWLGIRAKFHGTSEAEEKKSLEERRLRTVDAVIDELLSFRVDSTGSRDATSALKQVNAVMHRLDIAQSLYPSRKAFHLDKDFSMNPEFQARCDALNTWSTVLTSLRRQIALLRRWTGSDTLDVTQPNTNAEVAIGANPAHLDKDGRTEIADGTSFVERVLKEESMQKTFEKGFLTTVHSFIGAARDAQVNHSSLWKEMNLPTFENELVPLISFPTKLSQAGLCVILDHVQKLKDPDILIIDQVTDDLKLNIGLACTLKRQYEAFLAPDPGGNWNLPQCISEDYDATILEALSMFFRLIHWKLKSGAKGIYFKETDVLEAQWATFNDVSMTAAGGSSLVAEHLWYDLNFMSYPVLTLIFTKCTHKQAHGPSYKLFRDSSPGSDLRGST